MFLQKVFCPDVTWLGWLDVNGQLSVCLSAAVISGNCIPGQADWFLMHSDTDAAQQSGICTPAEYKLQWPPAHRPKLLSQSGRPRGHASRWVARIGFALLFISDKETEQVKVCAFDITAPPLSRPPHSCVCIHDTYTHARTPPPPPPIDGCAHMLGPNQTRLHICRAANRYILAIVCYAQGRCTMLLHSWSYHYAVPQKNKNCLFSIPCIRVGIKLTSNRLCVCLFVSKMLVVPQPIGVRVLTSWPIIVFGSIPTLMRHFLARRLLFSIISNHHAKARSWKWAPRWWISPKKRTPKFSGRVRYRTISVHCTISTECQACEVQRLLLQFLAECTTRQLEASHQQRKSERKYAEDFPLIFMGCDVIQVETLFTNFFVVHNITLSAANHDICSGAHFRKSKLQRRTICVCYAQNLITTLKIWFCYAKV